MLDVTKNYLPPVNGKNIECRTCGVSELCLPSGLTKGELENLDSVSKARRRMEKGDVLYHTAEKQTKIYAVSTGSYKTSITNFDGVEQVTGFYLPGDILGLDGLGGLCRHSAAVAMESSSVCEISETLFNALCGTNSGLRHSFMCIVRKEILRTQQHTMMLAQMSAEARVAGLIIDFSKRHEERGFSPAEFNLNMSRRDIGSYLGLTQETVSRLFRRFQNKDYINEQFHHIVIQDMDVLYKLSGAVRYSIGDP